jgi:hypothetical protein
MSLFRKNKRRKIHKTGYKYAKVGERTLTMNRKGEITSERDKGKERV